MSYLRIGDFSRLCRVSVRALRYYDEIGLLKPMRVDHLTGYRYYSFEQLPRLNRIIMLKSIGLSLEDIHGLLQEMMPVDHIRQLLQVKQAEIKDRLRDDQERLQQVNSWLERINSDGSMPAVDIQRKAIPELRVLCKREIGTYEHTPDLLKEELLEVLRSPENRDRVTIVGPIMMLAYDDEYKEKDADIEMALPVAGEITIDDPSIRVQVLPEVGVISVIHKGSFHNLDSTYARIFEYVEQHRLTLLAPVRELYFNNLEEVPEDQLLTEVQCPFNSK